MQKYMAAVCQMDSQDNKEKNLKTVERLISEAAGNGAQLIVLPETMNYMGPDPQSAAEQIPGETSIFLGRKAKEHGVWIAGGTMQEILGDRLPKNTMLLIGPDGAVCAKYSKLHMFDVQIEGGASSRESAVNTPGSKIVTVQTPLGMIGMAVCYDIRFPELFRLLALSGAQIICVPASFTRKTVQAHWETLLRARAIENGVYILAANQIGVKPTMTAGGHSMIIDPWGRVLAEAGEETGCIYTQIDLDYLDSVRHQIPSLKNRRTDVYRLEGTPALL